MSLNSLEVKLEEKQILASRPKFCTPLSVFSSSWMGLLWVIRGSGHIVRYCPSTVHLRYFLAPTAVPWVPPAPPKPTYSATAAFISKEQILRQNKVSKYKINPPRDNHETSPPIRTFSYKKILNF